MSPDRLRLLGIEKAQWSEPVRWEATEDLPFKEDYYDWRKSKKAIQSSTLSGGYKNVFEGDVIIQLLVNPGPDRLVRVYRPFTLWDSKGRPFPVPEGAIANGGSIPRPLWTVFGPPLVGDYRRTTIVHDYYCDFHVYSSEIVHSMLYDGTLLDSKSRIKANTVYYAVKMFGPDFKSE